jgi:hypothetical protein
MYLDVIIVQFFNLNVISAYFKIFIADKQSYLILVKEVTCEKLFSVNVTWYLHD